MVFSETFNNDPHNKKHEEMKKKNNQFEEFLKIFQNFKKQFEKYDDKFFLSLYKRLNDGIVSFLRQEPDNNPTNLVQPTFDQLNILKESQGAFDSWFDSLKNIFEQCIQDGFSFHKSVINIIC